jgi:hypothetical protein
VAKLLWQRPGATEFNTIPQAQLYAAPPAGDGLRAAYFNNRGFTGTLVRRIDPTVYFDWGNGSPDPKISPDTFSARWMGQIQAVETGTYTFRTNCDDKVRLWVNGKLVIDNWTGAVSGIKTGTIDLQAGQRYRIRLDYEENTGSAVMQLDWTRPGQSGFVSIPQANLFSAPTVG